MNEKLFGENVSETFEAQIGLMPAEIRQRRRRTRKESCSAHRKATRRPDNFIALPAFVRCARQLLIGIPAIARHFPFVRHDGHPLDRKVGTEHVDDVTDGISSGT